MKLINNVGVAWYATWSAYHAAPTGILHMNIGYENQERKGEKIHNG